MSPEWFRKTTWTKEDSEDFFAHLNRSRKYNRSQYLCIQAYHLHKIGSQHLDEIAVSLLDILFEEYPQRIQMAAAYELKAECLVALNKHDEAISYFRKSIEFQREFPNVRTHAPVTFGWFVVENKLKDLYDEVLHLLEEFGGNLSAFPRGRYEICSIQAFIHEEKNNPSEAKEFALQAMQASSETYSGFRNHPTLGLIKDTNTKTHKRLEEIIRNKVINDL